MINFPEMPEEIRKLDQPRLFTLYVFAMSLQKSQIARCIRTAQQI